MGGRKFSPIFLIVVCCIVFSRSQTAEANTCGRKMPCDNLRCIERNQWCDDKPDCLDGSDEKYCQTAGFFDWSAPDNKCDERRHFVCKSGKCVPIAVKCDGVDDCDDNSDEKICETPKTNNGFGDSDDFFDSDGKDNFNGQDPTVSSQTTSIWDTSEEFALPESTTVHSTSARPSRTHRTTASTVDYYGRRMTETQNSQAQNIYNRNKQTSPRFNSASDTAPAYDFPSNERTDSRDPQNRPDRVPSYDRRVIPSQAPVSRTPRTPLTPRNSPGAILSFPGRQELPVIHRPWAVIYSQTRCPGRTPVSNSEEKYRPLPPFHFEDDYAQFRNRYDRKVRLAERWLLEQRDVSYSWGKDTPRALVALSLITNSFPSNLTGYDFMKRRLRLDLGAKLLRSGKEPLSDSRLAMYINALLATCQDPRQIFDRDLTEMLLDRTYSARRKPVSPFIYITLCLANSSVAREDLEYLESIVNSNITDEVSKDRFILATSALACFQKGDTYEHELSRTLDTAFRKLLQQRLNDGSFGSIYSTAIAAQALIAINSKSWRPELTLDYLTRYQSSDGSFGDMLATYYAIPALSGRSLVHLRNTLCDKPIVVETPPAVAYWDPPGPKKSIFYALATEYHQWFSIALHMTVPVDANFFDIMQCAEYTDPRFKFLYKEHTGKIDVYTIHGIPNNPERGMYWNLYALNKANSTVDTNQIYWGDIRDLIPEDSQELLYWYLPFKPVNPDWL